MSPALLAPSALGALAVLAIPVVIHIARRTQTRTVAFAALRWLNPRPKRRRRLRIDERMLLAARLALLAAIVLSLAQPVLRGLADSRPVFAVAPGVDADRLPTPQQENARRIWLAPGFPSLDQALPAGSKGQDVASLIRQLDADLPQGALRLLGAGIRLLERGECEGAGAALRRFRAADRRGRPRRHGRG